MAEGPIEALADLSSLIRPLRSYLSNVGCDMLDRRIATLRRHLEPQPIESAPRDGTRILGFVWKWNDWYVLHWMPRTGLWRKDDGYGITEEYVLSWLPLPAPANQERRT